MFSLVIMKGDIYDKTEDIIPRKMFGPTLNINFSANIFDIYRKTSKKNVLKSFDVNKNDGTETFAFS